MKDMESPIVPISHTCPCGVPVAPPRVTCGAPVCQRRRSYALHAVNPRAVETNRARCRRWDLARGIAREPQPWLLGVPTWATMAPGVTTEVLVLPEMTVEFKDAIGLHGALSRLAATGHAGQSPEGALPSFALIPGETWAAHWLRQPDPALFGALHEESRAGAPLTVRGRRVALYLGMPRRTVLQGRWRRGRNLLRLDTLTPLILNATRQTGKGPAVHHRELTSATLESALSSLARRLYGMAEAGVKAEIVESAAIWEQRRLPGHWGEAPVITGRWTVAVNAVGARMLECAAVTGLGSRVALGYGRIVMSAIG